MTNEISLGSWKVNDFYRQAMRDELAGKAMASLLGAYWAEGNQEGFLGIVSMVAYAAADAMLAERAKGKDKHE
jgi:hypothetical protein